MKNKAKGNPLHQLSDTELAKKRKEYMLWGMIPATSFILLEMYILYHPEYKGMEIYALLGILASIPLVYQASKYSQEFRRRKGSKSSVK